MVNAKLTIKKRKRHSFCLEFVVFHLLLSSSCFVLNYFQCKQKKLNKYRHKSV